MSAETLYTIGLILVTLYLVTGIDDFIWDIVTLCKRFRQKDETLQFKEVEKTPTKLLSVIIAAWHEDNVLLDVVENIIASQQYPKSMYHIFLGVYPNDEATVYIAQQLEKKYANVHCVVNFKEGPTSKAQNINYVISRIKEYEEQKNWNFASITVHDSEDLVHPYELKVTNYLIDKHPAIQFPVFPLIKKPTLWNFFPNITTNTYADEFAENHFITMVSRRDSGAFVPSAGTGFALRRDTIDVLGYHVLPENSLTEDYKLSLTLYENGLQMHYVLEKLERVDFERNIQTEFIATRSMFPNTFKTAVRQKTRWTLGITMQSLRFKDIFNKKLSFAGKYSLYRDQKAKLGNLLSMVGYPVLIYFIASLFVELTPIYPKYTLSWYLCVAVTIMMLERQLFRSVSLKNIYGMRSVFFGVFFPPLVPIRIVWGNIINLVATTRAYIQYMKGKHKPKEQDEEEAKEAVLAAAVVPTQAEVVESEETEDLEPSEDEQMVKFEWSKTEHSFLSKAILTRFHRKFGDVLIAMEFITAKDLQDILKEKEKEEQDTEEKLFIGEYLMEKSLISENQFVSALTAIKNIPYINHDTLPLYDLDQFQNAFSRDYLEKVRAFPLLKTDDGYVFVYGTSTPLDAQSKLRSKYQLDSQAVLAIDQTVSDAIDMIFAPKSEKASQTKETIFNEKLVAQQMTVEQLILVRNHAIKNEAVEEKIAIQMGVHKTANDTPHIDA